MKEGWTYKKLGEVASILHGKNQKEVFSDTGIYPILGSGGNIMGYAKRYLCEAGTTLLGRKGSINNPLFIKERFWNVDTAFGISAKEGNDSKFLYYFIKTVDWSKKNTGTTLPSLTQQVIKSVELPVPPLSEQQRIVSYLDSAFAQIDELKAKAEKQLSEAKALFQKALSKAMEPKEGWEEKTLKGLTTKIGSGATPKGGKKVYIGEGTSLVRSMNVHNNEFKYKDLAHINKDASTQLDCVELKPKDVLFNITGASIARCCIVPDNILPARVNQHVSILRPITDIISPQFLCLVLLSASHQKELLAIGVAGSTRQAITKSDLENHVIKIPSLSDQHRIVTYLDTFSEKVKSLEANLNKVTAECAALKQSILRQVFE